MDSVGHEVVTFDTSTVVPADRFDAWREAVDAAFVPLRAAPHSVAGYQSDLLAQDLGENVMATEVGGSPVTVWRDRATIAISDPGVYKLGLQLQGCCVLTQDGREAALAPGDLAIYDTTRTYRLDCADFYRMFVLLIPRDRIGLTATQIGQLTAQRISGRQSLGALSSSLLAQVGMQVQAGGVDTTPRVVDAIIDLVRATLSRQLDGTATTPGASTIMIGATAWIDSHIRDPGLTVEDVASSQHVSVRYLQRLFADHGTTPSSWIRQRRIRHCQTDLVDPALAARSTAAIGAAWGFPDPSAFSRLFKANTGMTPGEYRSTRLG